MCLKTLLGVVSLSDPERVWSRYSGFCATCPGGTVEMRTLEVDDYQVLGNSRDYLWLVGGHKPL